VFSAVRAIDSYALYALYALSTLPYEWDPSSRQVAEERDAQGGVALWRHRAEYGHLECAAYRADLRLAHLRDAMEYQLHRLLIEWGDRDRPSGDPAVLISGRELVREPLLDDDDQLVQ
jgi:hypothetical protein